MRLSSSCEPASCDQDGRCWLFPTQGRWGSFGKISHGPKGLACGIPRTPSLRLSARRGGVEKPASGPSGQGVESIPAEADDEILGVGSRAMGSWLRAVPGSQLTFCFRLSAAFNFPRSPIRLCRRVHGGVHTFIGRAQLGIYREA